MARNYQRRGGGFKKYRKQGIARTYFKGTPFQKYAKMAYKGFRIATRIAGMVNVEYKVNDTGAAVAPVTGSPTFQLLNAIATGDDYTNRDGRQVRLKSVQCSIRCLVNSVNSSVANVGRWIIFIDKQPDAGAPVIGDLLDTTNGSINVVDCHRNLNNRKRFVILKDRRFVLNTINTERVYDYFKKIDMKTVYDGTAADQASIDGNAFYLVMITDQSTNPPDWVYNTRVRFIDN